jgi:hypothetical protein
VVELLQKVGGGPALKPLVFAQRVQPVPPRDIAMFRPLPTNHANLAQLLRTV